MSYIEAHLDDSPLGKPVVSCLTRRDGQQLTSAMLGEMSVSRARLATLGQMLDLGLAFVERDGEVTISFPKVAGC